MKEVFSKELIQSISDWQRGGNATAELSSLFGQSKQKIWHISNAQKLMR